MKRSLMAIVACVSMLIGIATAPLHADEQQRGTDCSHNRWVDPIFDCEQFSDNLSRFDACGHLSRKINKICGFKKPDLVLDARADVSSVFDPLAPIGP
jgi:hypothetical protein